jgi:hypothetical protein
MPVVEITSLEDVRPGDLMFTNIGGLFPGVFPVKAGMLLIGERMRLGPLSIDHVGVVTQAMRKVSSVHTVPPIPPRMVQAMPGGAEEVPLHPDKYWKNNVAFCRLPEDYPGQAEDAAAIARLFVKHKVKYSFGSYAMLAAHHWGYHAQWLEDRINRRRDEVVFAGIHEFAIQLPVEAICSVLADQSWTLTGKKVMMGTVPQVVTPGGLALQMWRRPGVVWGGAGLAV